MQVSQYYYNKGQTKTRISYASQTMRTQNNRLAIQKGVCDWVSYRNEAFYELLQKFEEWSVRTYEGKKVTYGFIFDPHASSTLPENSYGKWLDFVSDDYSATLTDCIHSVIRLDSNCNFSEYISLLFEGILKNYLLAQDEYISGRIWDLTMELVKRNGVNEDLKRCDQMRWVQEINSFRHMAEEMVLAEYFE